MCKSATDPNGRSQTEETLGDRHDGADDHRPPSVDIGRSATGNGRYQQPNSPVLHQTASDGLLQNKPTVRGNVSTFAQTSAKNNGTLVMSTKIVGRRQTRTPISPIAGPNREDYEEEGDLDLEDISPLEAVELEWEHLADVLDRFLLICFSLAVAGVTASIFVTGIFLNEGSDVELL